MRTLAAPVEIEHTYRRATCGPSGYAFVKLRCEPAASLTFVSAAEWPASLGSRYTAQLDAAVQRGIDEIFKSANDIVCRVVLTAIGWDDVQSSEKAFQNATREALTSLATDQRLWTVQT